MSNDFKLDVAEAAQVPVHDVTLSMRDALPAVSIIYTGTYYPNDSDGNTPVLRRRRARVSVWSHSQTEAEAIADRIESGVKYAFFQSRDSWFFEAARRYTVRLDAEVWQSRV